MVVVCSIVYLLETSREIASIISISRAMPRQGSVQRFTEIGPRAAMVVVVVSGIVLIVAWGDSHGGGRST